jgi:hypothetical protein
MALSICNTDSLVFFLIFLIILRALSRFREKN